MAAPQVHKITNWSVRSVAFTNPRRLLLVCTTTPSLFTSRVT